MTTKEKILKEALALFAEKGYHAVYVADIAKAVGIKAPSLYKHYKSKQGIFDAIIEHMKMRYAKTASSMNIDGVSPSADATVFSAVSEDDLVKMGKDLFLYFLHDEYAQMFRKLLTVEQFRDKELSNIYSKQYVDDPISYQSSIFACMAQNGLMRKSPPDVMALEFYAPIYMMLTLCDRQPDREADALLLIERHIRQFRNLYTEERP